MTSAVRPPASEPLSIGHQLEKGRRNGKVKKVSIGHNSDSEGSGDSNSLSNESNPSNDGGTNQQRSPNKINAVPSQTDFRRSRRGSEWEILEGLKDGQRFEKKPAVFEGYLMKKRKWPLKGWHKRYFVVDKGILVYAKGPGEVARGKLHGSIDIALSVVSTKPRRRRLDIDAEEYIYHLKAKSPSVFSEWVEQLKRHRLYRQHILSYGTRVEGALLGTPASLDDDSPSGILPLSAGTPLSPVELPSRDGSLTRGVKPPSSPPVFGSRLSAWLSDTTLEHINKELLLTQQNLFQLGRILENIENLPFANTDVEVVEACSPNVKKDRKMFGLRKKKSSKGSTVDLTGSSPSRASHCDADSVAVNHMTSSISGLSQMASLSNSNPSLCTPPTSIRPHSLPSSDHLVDLAPDGIVGKDLSRFTSGTPETRTRQDYFILAKEIHTTLRTVLRTLNTERERIKQVVESEGLGATTPTSMVVVAGLRHSLSQALQQNNDLRNRLSRIHTDSDLSDISLSLPPVDMVQKALHQSLSYSSSCLSTSEFYDAQENQTDAASETSSEASMSSEEGSFTSENSDVGNEYTPAESVVTDTDGTSKCTTGRRTKLLAPKPDTEGLSLWNLLRKNIGKDLSKISMPVALNEPLSMLQRLCEELEYSELLDKASETDDPYERMVLVAAFAVSSYGSSYFRAGHKPFNPLLGETYEAIREDRGFRFVSEQVSHHPPVSVCFAESRNFIYWQDVRIKTKFWGKSLEFQPTGTVSLHLPRYGDIYKWNKVTTCVHNLFGGQRWVDQYGELTIHNSIQNITCKLTFVKASYWSAKRHEVFGAVYDSDGKDVRNLFGKWNEALYCGVAPSARCIWRPGTMPEDYELYYGFTRFAIELNELDPEMAKYLPPSDSRFRPDQRLLEEGDLNGAENLKQMLEQSQRDRRKKKDQDGFGPHEPKWFRKTVHNGEEIWEYNGKYWECRQNTGFVNLQFEQIW